MKFIEVKEIKDNGKVLINLEQVSHIFIELNAIVLSGNHWSDMGAWGMLYIDEESMKKIIKEIIANKNKEYKKAFKNLKELIYSCDFYRENEHEKDIDLIDTLIEKVNDWSPDET